MAIPRVALVGRPNVGKSSLLNWLSGKRLSVVDSMAGVTRDRVTYLMHEADRYFELVDTGGMGLVDADHLEAEIERQIEQAVEEADLILFVVDALSGLSPLDEPIAERLRRAEKPILLVANKCDSPATDMEAYHFYRLLDAPLLIVSTRARRNRQELIEAVLHHLPTPDREEAIEGETLVAEPELKLAIVGRRNVGKSTFLNELAKSERVIVSEVPGTTRDSIDVHFQLDRKAIVAIDTPGVRRRKSISSDVEFYGLARAKRSVRRADVVMVFFDSQQTISKVDKQLVSEIREHNKPSIFVVNKWDLAEGMTTEAWSDYLLNTFGDLRYIPVAFITATRGRNVKKLVNLAQSLFKQARTRVPTGQLNRVVQAAVEKNPPPYRANKRPKIFFATQVATEPPTIVLKCNEPKLFSASWKRYLLGVLRDELPFEEVPIKLHFRRREREETAAGEFDETSWRHD